MEQLLASWVEVLRQDPAALLVWRGLAAVALLYLFGMGVLCFVAPDFARRFFSGFAANWVTNTGEAILRGAIGLAFVALSPDTRAPTVFLWGGVFLAVSALGIGLFRRTHHRFAKRVVPEVQRFIKPYGGLSILFGALVFWGLSPAF